MKYRKICSAAVVLLIILIAGCSSLGTRAFEGEIKEYGITVPPLEFVTPYTRKTWEGKIEGRSTACFRYKKGNVTQDVVVVIQDDFPAFFKRIEYLDREGDGALDAVSMKIYEEGKGWRNVGITRENKYGLGYADNRYKEVLDKIEKAKKR
jgi:hypothetical protein